MSMTSSVCPPLRVFVVENDPDTLEYLTLYLKQAGHSVRVAETLEEAIADLPQAGCDVLISDIGLPDGSGWDLLTRAHLKKPIFAIAMSGFGMNADQDRSEQAGYRHHLLKPFLPAALDALLEEAAREKRR